jgi:hypothetical protein
MLTVAALLTAGLSAWGKVVWLTAAANSQKSASRRTGHFVPTADLMHEFVSDWQEDHACEPKSRIESCS